MALNASASFAGLFSTAYGADGAGTTVYALSVGVGASGLIDTATNQAVVLSLVGGVVEGRTATSNDLVFTVSVNSASGLVTLDQIRAVVHTTSSNPDTSEGAGLSLDSLIALTATVTDKDGDTATASVNIGSNLTFLDDGPSLGTIQNGTANNSVAAALTTGSLHFAPGADGAGSAMTIGATLTGVHSGGFNLVTNQVGNVLTAYQDANGNGVYNSLTDTTAVFTLTITPTGGPGGGFYTFDLLTPLSPTVVNTPLGGTTSFGSGPAPYQVLSATTVATDPLTIITGWHTDVTFNAANWYNGTNVLPAGVTIANVNGSTSGWGVDNNNFTAGEFIRWDFGEPIDDFDGPGGYVPPNPAVDLPNISTVTFELIGYTASDHFQWVVHFTDGTFANFTNDGTAGVFTYSAPSGKIIDWVDTYTADAGSGKIDIVSVGVESTSLNNNLGFSVQLTDGDGDPTGTGSFTINVQTSNVPSSATPVVLDTNGDGVVSFIAHDAGAHYDYNGDGKAEATAWVAPGDSILVRDANGNGLVDNASEFVFGHDGMTDLEALHAQYGAQLDASDADFTMFAVWNDGNSNGIVDSGELMSLAEAGITSIGLVSNGVSYATAGGDVNVAGSSSFTRADGTTGTVADASFLRTADSIAQTERVAANSNSVVVAAAIAAAGLAVSSSAAASVGDAKADVGHAVQAVIPVTTFDVSNIGLHTETAVAALTGGMDTTFNVPQVMPHVAIGADIGLLSSGEIAGAHSAMAAPAELLAGSDMIAGQIAMPILASNIAMPSLDALVAMAGPGSAQSASSVEQIVAEALHGGGNGPDINALLNALPGQAGGADAAPQIMASLGNGPVPSWDTGHGGAFTFAATDAITSEALVLHHDAIQPIANG